MSTYLLRYLLPLTGLLLTTPAAAQLPRVDNDRLGVDMLRLQTGERLYGFILDTNEAQIEFAVESQWLEKTYPELAASQVEDLQQNSAAATAQLLQRIDTWMQERAGDQDLLAFLASERQRLAERSEQPLKTPRFLRLNLPRTELRDIARQPADRRQIAGLAYMHGLENVIGTPTSLLQKELEQRGIDVRTTPVDLSQDLPPDGKQSDQQWAVRVALVEFQLREPLEFQGTGTTFVRKGAEIEISQLFGTMLAGGDSLNQLQQLGADLGLPEFTNREIDRDWWSSIAQEAEREDFRGALVMRLQPNSMAERAVVEAVFLARQSAGEWLPALTFRVEEIASQQPAERVQQLKADPSVQQALQLMEGLGIVSGERLDQALRFGAATHAALGRAQGEFYLHLGKQTRRLDD